MTEKERTTRRSFIKILNFVTLPLADLIERCEKEFEGHSQNEFIFASICCHLCALYQYNKIEDIDNIVEKMKRLAHKFYLESESQGLVEALKKFEYNLNDPL